MTAATAAGAASHEGVDWQAIDWPKAHALVRRLQARIVKATQAGRWGKVKALQRLLTHSWSGKVLAVKRVTENPGKHKCITRDCRLRRCILHRMFERLERYAGKLARAVLRGRDGGNTVLLPGTWVGNHPGLPGNREFPGRQ